MIEAEKFVDQLRQAGFGLFSGVPCSYLTPLINAVIDAPDIDYIGATNEGDAVAIACGSELGGRRGVVMFQIPGEPTPVERPRTRDLASLPRTASRAAIEAPPALRCAPGAVLPLRIRVRNEGTHTWSTMG